MCITLSHGVNSRWLPDLTKLSLVVLGQRITGWFGSLRILVHRYDQHHNRLPRVFGTRTPYSEQRLVTYRGKDGSVHASDRWCSMPQSQTNRGSAVNATMYVTSLTRPPTTRPGSRR